MVKEGGEKARGRMRSHEKGEGSELFFRMGLRPCIEGGGTGYSATNATTSPSSRGKIEVLFLDDP